MHPIQDVGCLIVINGSEGYDRGYDHAENQSIELYETDVEHQQMNVWDS
jgi:hypothetical protein